MGENQGIEQVLGKLVELLTAKKDQVSSSSREIVVHAEPVQKIELMPNDVKLEGIKNYLAWPRRALRLLKAKKNLKALSIGNHLSHQISQVLNGARGMLPTLW